MADTLLTTKYYQLLGGVNQKFSQYQMSTAQFLNIRNMDSDVPNALQKRPGSTYGIGSANGTSGPISTLFEFVKLDGSSYIMTASDTAIFYIANNAYTLLSSGWNNGQPPNMLTFVNKLWLANGQSFASWNASYFNQAGMQAQRTGITGTVSGSTPGGSYFFVGGATMSCIATGVDSGQSNILRGVYVAYSYVRNDGYQGPADFITNARNVVLNKPANATEHFTNIWFSTLWGLTAPAALGITQINLYMAVDTVTPASATLPIISSPGGVTSISVANVGAMGFFYNTGANFRRMSDTLIPSANLGRFFFYTSVPAASLFLSTDGVGTTFWSTTFAPGGSFFEAYNTVSTGAQAFSGMPFDFFSTYIPKYIELNQNSMFMAGFSAFPSTVWFAQPGVPETILPTNTFEVRTNDGDRVFGMKAFNNQLLIMKEKSFHRLTGSNANNYQLVQVSGDYGCLSNKTIVSYQQTLLWLDKKGILSFNGSSFNIISDAVEGIFKRMNIAAAKEKACAVHAIYRNQIWFGIPIDGSATNNITVVYDYLAGGWTFFDGFNPSAFGLIKGALTKPTVWRGDYSGLVHYTSESFYADSGQGITCLALPRFENVGGENQTTLWRRFFLDNNVATGLTGQITGQVFTNYDTSTVRATFACYQATFQNRIEMGVQGKAVTVQLAHFSASLPLLINGYGLANRGLRNV